MKNNDVNPANIVLNHPAKPRLMGGIFFRAISRRFPKNLTTTPTKKTNTRPEVTTAVNLCSVAAFGLSYAVVKITRPLLTTGDELPSPGILVFHLIFSLLLLQISGRPRSDDTPRPPGPRHCGHGPAGLPFGPAPNSGPAERRPSEHKIINKNRTVANNTLSKRFIL
jgi:hypothetical protein